MDRYEYGGFNTRRKRNLNVGPDIAKERIAQQDTLGIEWDDRLPMQTSLSNPIPQPVEINTHANQGTNFQKDFSKLTIYVENNLLGVIKELKKQRHISSYSKLVNDAVVQFLTNRQY